AGGTATISNCTFTANTAQGGAGGDGQVKDPNLSAGGNGGDGFGGGLYLAGGTISLLNVSVTANVAQGGAGGNGHPRGATGQGIGGGLFHAKPPPPRGPGGVPRGPTTPTKGQTPANKD